ncbi:zinc metalloprotease HtpX [bacterium]|nr:zinc metalloprotease HtpX [bacterium]
MAMFLALVIAIGYGVAWYLGNSAILYGAIAFALIMNVGSYWFSDKLVLRMTGAQPADPNDPQQRELIRMVENLSITAGLPMPKVYVVNDPAPNAFATGRNPDNAVVAATTGIIEILERNELEGVMAHELAHVGNRDMLVMTVAVVLAGFVAMVADFFSRALLFDGNRNDRHPAFLIIGIVGIILAPIAAQLMQMAISRKREYLADASGAMLTRYPEGLASALEKISSTARPMKRASHATAHLFISDPFAGGKPSFWQKVGGLFHTHPPAPERIARLRAMDV